MLPIPTVEKVNTYSIVRRAVLVEGRSQRQIAKDLGLNRRTVGKMVKQSQPSGYQRQKDRPSPKLEEHRLWIDTVLEQG